MEMTFKIEGLDQINKATVEVQKNVRDEINKALLASAIMVHREASKSITDGKKTGKIYKVRTVSRQASAAGEAPANQTGTLLRSLSFYNFKDRLEAVITSRLKYAVMLEFGTIKMAARPFLFPAYEKSKAKIQERLNQAVRTAAIKSVKK